jgi:hypothetical protein
MAYKPMATAALGDQLYVFAVGVDQFVRMSIATQDQGFGAWNQVPRIGTFFPVSAASSQGAGILLFAIAEDGLLWYNVLVNQAWEGWNKVGDGRGGQAGFSMPVNAVEWRNSVYLFRLAEGLADPRAGRRMYYTSTTDFGANWALWKEVGGGGLAICQLAAATLNNDSRLILFAIGTDYKTYSNFTDDGQNWSGWSEVPGQPLNDWPVAAVNSGGKLYLFTAWPLIDLSRIYPNPSSMPYRMLVNVSSDGQNWSGAREIGGGGRAGSPLTAADFGGRPWVFVADDVWRSTYYSHRLAV